MLTPLRLKLPATSANLGPGFDALGLAMQLYLEVEATPAPEFHIEASGRDARLTGSLHRNLMLKTYVDLAPTAPALSLAIRNQIPLGMGCGSSATALLAGVHLASHFGGLGMTPQQVLDEACRREGHPDNVAACFYGGLTASAMGASGVTAASFGAQLPWRLLVAVPSHSLATAKARALLPEACSLADAVANIQSTALLVSAFALGRPELLAAGTRDRLHQPYRSQACPLLPLLLPLAGHRGVYSVTLSGAGPSVLLIADPSAPVAPLLQAIRLAACDPTLEIVATGVSVGYMTE